VAILSELRWGNRPGGFSIPSRHAWLVVVASLVGAAVGLAGYTFVYARGYSYLQNDPAACANCHVMRQQLDGWIKGSHRAVAVCNDCHTPHTPVGKYLTKIRNGFWHSFYFTTGTFDEPIRILPRDRDITENACRTCHTAIVEAMGVPQQHGGAFDLSCTRCHGSVGHLELALGSMSEMNR
jgi:cytochrome c nitrite reductase small subunit